MFRDGIDRGRMEGPKVESSTQRESGDGEMQETIPDRSRNVKGLMGYDTNVTIELILREESWSRQTF